MSKFHTLQVKRVRASTADASLISFSVPEQLKNQFQYLPGQYLTLKLNIDGEVIHRSYSFCSAEAAGEDMTIAVKRVQQGKGSNFINDAFKEGMDIEVMEPMGNFHSLIQPSNQLHYVLFGGGSGITPLFSILKTVLLKEPLSKVSLFYGNRNSTSIIFKNELEEWVNQFPNRLKVVHILDYPEVGWNGYTGFILKDKALQLLRENAPSDLSRAEFFICGPTPMMKETESALHSLNISKEKIHIEYFTAKAEEDKVAAEVGKADNQPAFEGVTTVKIIYDKKEVEFQVKEEETILHAALNANYDPPYSCMVAACCTCRAKLVSGIVDMEDRESLTDAEIKNGYVLTCQAHPKSHGIVLNYDI